MNGTAKNRAVPGVPLFMVLLLLCSMSVRAGIDRPVSGQISCEVMHHYADLGDVRIHYVTAGKGEPVVLLHGWPQTWYEWRDVIPLLSGNYSLIVPDMRGLGDSSRPKTGYEKISLADDIFRLMSGHLGYKQWKVVGHDWGTAVAYALAATHPEAVEQLVLIEGALPDLTGKAHEGIGFNIRELHISGKGWHMNFHLNMELPELLSQGREEIYLGWFYRNLASPSYEMPDETVEEYLRTYTQPGAMTAGFNYYRTWPREVDKLYQLTEGKKLPMPILRVSGTDPYRQRPDLKRKTPPNMYWLKSIADDVSGVMIEESGHWVPEEQPEVLSKCLLEFFNNESSASKEKTNENDF